MARKSAKNMKAVPNSGDVEAGIVKLAEQLGWLVGTAQRKADQVLDNDALKKQVTLVRDGAAELLKQVNSAGAAAAKQVSSASAAAAKQVTIASAAAKKLMPGAAAKKAAAAKLAGEQAKRAQSRKPVAAPGKKHRKPPPQEKIERHMSEPKVKQMGQQGIKGRMQRAGQLPRRSL